MTMSPTTLVLAYYDNADMLRVQYDAVRALSDRLRDQLSVVVVDDGSPNRPAFAEDLDGVGLQVYRVRKDIRWNQDACRNIGVRHAETNWVLLTDMDHLPTAKLWDQVLLREWDPHTAYTFRRVSAPDMTPYKPHPNSWLMSRRLYDEVGGYDERFAGYYGTDGDFRDRLVARATAVKQIKADLVRYPRTLVSDASTTTYLRKQPEDLPAIARIRQRRASLASEDQRPLRYRFKYDRVHPPTNAGSQRGPEAVVNDAGAHGRGTAGSDR